VVSLFVSFNGPSTLVRNVETDLVAALRRRIALALSDASIDRFSASMDGGGVDRWLDECRLPVVLLVDELNKAIRAPAGRDASEPELLLVKFLKDFFMDSKQPRMLVMSTHINDTASGFGSDYYPSETPSFRQVDVLALPLIRDIFGVAQRLQHSPTAIFLAGRIPGNVIAWKSVENHFASTIKGSDELIAFRNNIKLFAHACLDSSLAAELPSDVRKNGIYEGRKHLWTPFVIAHALVATCPGQFEPLRKLMDRAFTAKEGTGDAWEVLMLLALLVHFVAGSVSELSGRIVSALDLLFVRESPEWTSTLDDVITWLTHDQKIRAFPYPVGSTHIIFPEAADFNLYDLVVVRLEKDGWKPLLGYQMKLGKAAPSGNALQFPSFLMSGSTTPRTNSRADGWRKPNRDELTAFLGHSLSRAYPQFVRDSVAADRLRSIRSMKCEQDLKNLAQADQADPATRQKLMRVAALSVLAAHTANQAARLASAAWDAVLTAEEANEAVTVGQERCDALEAVEANPFRVRAEVLERARKKASATMHAARPHANKASDSANAASLAAVAALEEAAVFARAARLVSRAPRKRRASSKRTVKKARKARKQNPKSNQ